MSTSKVNTPPAALTAQPQISSAGRFRFGAPSLADAVFVVLLLRCLQLGATDFFNDPGTGWHLRTGSDIVATGGVPRTDTYSHTRAGHQWVETQWFADVLTSLTFSAGGYPLVALLTAILLAALFRWIYRTHMVNGGWPVIGLLTALIAACAASGHFLARPLVASSIGVPLCFWWATQYARGKIDNRRLCLLVPITAVWCNLHPGVLGGIATVTLCGIGCFANLLITGSGTARSVMLRRGMVLLAVSTAMGAATLINPYGLEWHRWIVKLMGMGLLAQHIQEWKPPVWTDVDTIAAATLVAAVVLGTAIRRRGTTPAEGLVILFWLCQAPRSYRHLPLLAMILAIQLGRILANVRVASPRLRRIGSRIPLFSTDLRNAELRGGGVASAAISVLLGALLIAGTTVPAIGLGIAGPPAKRYSAQAVDYLRANPPDGPIFNDILYGGMLIRNVPDVPVFMDDRFGLYGESLLANYVEVYDNPQNSAEKLFNDWWIDTVMIKASTRLCNWLADNPEWTEVYQDRITAIYTRKPSPRGEHS